MRPKYREDKTTQAACYLLRREGGRMNYMKLIKLLYLADRKRLVETGRPISFDRYYSLDYGLVLSSTKDLIVEGAPPGRDSYWQRFISAPEQYNVSVIGDCPDGALSDAEAAALSDIYDEYGSLDQWQLSTICHNLPEWQDPDGSAIPVSPHDILLRAGKTPLEAAEIEGELESLAVAEKTFG